MSNVIYLSSNIELLIGLLLLVKVSNEALLVLIVLIVYPYLLISLIEGLYGIYFKAR